MDAMNGMDPQHMLQQAAETLAAHTSAPSSSSTGTFNTSMASVPAAAAPKKKPTKSTQSDNPEVLTDAVAASGVNIRAEEEAMLHGLSISKKQIEHNTFLKPHQLSWFAQKTLEEQGIKSVTIDNEVGNLISASCEDYMTSIITDLIVMMRHRRHLSDKSTKDMISKGSNKSKISKVLANSGANSKSELSRALRDLASKHKEREEKRIRRRTMLGLVEEKPEEVLAQDHKQTNITASMMMSGSKKQKYSWMQAGSTQSASINSRGDNGIRYREAREEPQVVMRDLIAALENRRIGVSNALLKAYARLKD